MHLDRKKEKSVNMTQIDKTEEQEEEWLQESDYPTADTVINDHHA